MVKISEALEHTLVAICSEPITNLGLEEIIMMIMIVGMIMIMMMERMTPR